jgi:hypothetical protein
VRCATESGGSVAGCAGSSSRSTSRTGTSVAKVGRCTAGADRVTSHGLSMTSANAHNVDGQSGKEVRVDVRRNVHPT